MRHGRGNVLYVRFTPRPPEPEPHWGIFSAAGVLSLLAILLAVVLYLFLPSGSSP
jgi:hypothetical protein